MGVISNSIPLIHLTAAGYLPVLQEIFDEIFIPEAVHSECVLQGKGRQGAHEIAQSPWIRVLEVGRSRSLQLLQGKVDRSEAEAICLALEQSTPSLLLLDEASARKTARSLELPVMGSIGILWRAAKENRIDSFRRALDQLETTGFWMHSNLKERVLRDWMEIYGPD